MALRDTLPAEAPAGSTICSKCSGSGTFYGRGAVVNGKFEGFSGPCFGCQGKGWQAPKDQRRNRYYWDHIARIACVAILLAHSGPGAVHNPCSHPDHQDTHQTQHAPGKCPTETQQG
jgi:hypothetical protein